MLSIGNPNTFACEIHSDDLSAEYVEIYLIVSGMRVSGRNPAYIGTVVAELRGFLECHEFRVRNDFSSMQDVEVFQLFRRIANEDRTIEGISPSDVHNYFCLHNIDDAVDDWEIYVYESQCETRIVCRAKDASNDEDGLICARLPSDEFINTLTQFVAAFVENDRAKRH